MRKLALLVAALAASMVAGCGGDDGSFTLVTDIDFNNTPVSGTFTVSEGEDALGCLSGTFVDSPNRQALRGERPTVITTIYTCTEGDRGGSFVTRFPFPGRLWGTALKGEIAESRWRFERGTDDFTGLEGNGDISVTINGRALTGFATLTGKVRHEQGGA